MPTLDQAELLEGSATTLLLPLHHSRGRWSFSCLEFKYYYKTRQWVWQRNDTPYNLHRPWQPWLSLDTDLAPGRRDPWCCQSWRPFGSQSGQSYGHRDDSRRADRPYYWRNHQEICDKSRKRHNHPLRKLWNEVGWAIFRLVAPEYGDLRDAEAPHGAHSYRTCLPATSREDQWLAYWPLGASMASSSLRFALFGQNLWE